MPEPVGSIALRTKGGLLAAMQTGIYVWESGRLQLLACPDEHDKTHRFNDGRCDRAGRFWVGTMKGPEHTQTGALYRLSANKVTKRFRSSIKVPNSLAWSPDGRTMYFADSPRRVPRRLVRRRGGRPVERGVRRSAGAQLDTLYITTAQDGGVYAVNCPVKGLAEARFAG